MDFLSWLANWASIISLVLMVFGELSFVVWWRKHNKAVDGLTKAFDSDEDMPLIRKLGIDPNLSDAELHDRIFGCTDFFVRYNKTIQNKLPRNLLATVWGSSTLQVPQNAVHLKAYTLLLEVRYLRLLAEKDARIKPVLEERKAQLCKYNYSSKK